MTVREARKQAAAKALGEYNREAKGVREARAEKNVPMPQSHNKPYKPGDGVYWSPTKQNGPGYDSASRTFERKPAPSAPIRRITRA